MPFLTSLLILIVSARLLGQLFTRFQQPAIVGEMLAGVLLGPAMLDLVHASQPLHGIAELAVFLIVLSAGLEMSLKEVMGAICGRGLVIALLGFFVPLFSGFGVGLLFDLGTMKSIFLGLCVSITALPVAVRILESFGLLGTEIARQSVATAILNDVAALLVLGVILGLPEERTLSAVALSFVAAAGKLGLLAVFVAGCNFCSNGPNDRASPCIGARRSWWRRSEGTRSSGWWPCLSWCSVRSARSSGSTS